MGSKLIIKQVAVLGAGVMGAQIAAHFANIGIKIILFDLPSNTGTANGLAANSIQALARLNPQPLVTNVAAQLIISANYNDHLTSLQDCQLIIEAISERLDWKQDLYSKIVPFIKPGAILATNTSGLNISALAQCLPDRFRANFVGVHFFNPPRYMHLVELIAHAQTDPALLDQLEAFLVTKLGKGVVRAKDTPNFIANRIGVFSLLNTIKHAEQYDIAPDMVDAITGALIGRPKSATFRTLDLIGLDTFAHVVKTMHDCLAEDPWHAFYQVPEWLTKLVARGALGSKSKGGIYKKIAGEIKVIDSSYKEYRTVYQKVPGTLQAIMRQTDVATCFAELQTVDLPEAKFLFACFRDLWHYCAYHLQNIANDTTDIDFAMRWGFGWERGPFELWQVIGWEKVATWLHKAINAKQTFVAAALPNWVTQGTAIKNDSADIYHKPRFHGLPVYQRQYFPEILLNETLPKGKTILVQEDFRLWTLANNAVNTKIAIFSVKTKKNTLTSAALTGILQAIEIAERDYDALILWPDTEKHFSFGANLRDIIALVNANKWTQVEQIIVDFQRASLALRYSIIPTIAVTRGLTLGGGCELMLHCDLVVAALESYIGLVEVGIGVIPAGGGTKELARRAAAAARQIAATDLIPFIVPAYQTIAQAKVSQSAYDAQEKGLLTAKDVIVTNLHESLYVAHQYAHVLAEAVYQPPSSHKFAVAGHAGITVLRNELEKQRSEQLISEHDYQIGCGLATVICGGEVASDALVTEQQLLDLEREVFMQLLQIKATKERILYTLEHGKPLRN